MTFVNTVIVGAGQAGLAASRLLTEARRDHVVLERGRVAERWLSTSWDSLRLLTPNWMTRLPHWQYAGNQPDGFMRASQVAQFLEAYGESFKAPVVTETTVHRLRMAEGGFAITTNRGDWRADNVVVATGWCERPAVPLLAAQLDRSIHQLTPDRYRHPEQLADGAVLIVGASATGVQLADELSRSGRTVYVAVGSHSRMTRRYRGRDIFYWLERTGSLDRTIDDMPSSAAARHEPSLQLVGRTDRTLDLPSLASRGVLLTGRLTGLASSTAFFADDLQQSMLHADARLSRLLARVDAHIAAHHLPEGDVPPESFVPSQPIESIRCLNLRRAGVSTIVWATGHRRNYAWLDIPVLDAYGELSHRQGITDVPGLYVLGQRFQRTRRSNFLDGVGADARFITHHLDHRKD